MKIEQIILREIRMSLNSPFETSFGVIQDRRIVLVEVVSDGISGWGEVTTGEAPSYNSETTETAWHVISDFIAPLVVDKLLQSATEVAPLLSGIRGHEMAKAGIENAIWDIEAQQKKMALAQLLGGTRKEIRCGVSLGIRENPLALVRAVEKELRCGYQRIKLKIKPGKDMEFAATVRKEFPDIQLSVDANSAYTLADSEHLKRFDDFGLLMIEQPLAWNDIYSHAKLQAQLRTALCLDECISNIHHAAAAIEQGACRIINIKLGRVGGYSCARQVHDLCSQHSIPVWCGGMLESGIGRAHNIAMSTLPNFILPGDVSASRRYWQEDIVEPEIEVTPQGTISVPSGSGLGFEVKRDLVERFTARTRNWNAKVAVAT